MRLAISPEVARQGDVTVRGVTVRSGSEQHSARCFFRIVNGRAVYSVGECDAASFDAICDALDRKGDKRVARLLGGVQ